MGRCKDCIFWEVPEDRLSEVTWVAEKVTTHGHCKRIPHAPHGFKSEEEVAAYKKHYKGEGGSSYFSSRPDEMVVEDASGYYAEANSGPEFGCVLWEKRDG